MTHLLEGKRWRFRTLGWEDGNKVDVSLSQPDDGDNPLHCQMMLQDVRASMQAALMGNPAAALIGLLPSCSKLPCGCSVPPDGTPTKSSDGKEGVQMNIEQDIAAVEFDREEAGCLFHFSVPNGRIHMAFIVCGGIVHFPQPNQLEDLRRMLDGILSF